MRRVSIAFLALVPPLILWNSWILSVLWGWFVVPLGIPAIGVAHAFGLFILVKLFHNRRLTRDEEVNEDFIVKQVLFNLFGGAVTLLMGWIAQGFMNLPAAI